MAWSQDPILSAVYYFDLQVAPSSTLFPLFSIYMTKNDDFPKCRAQLALGCGNAMYIVQNVSWTSSNSPEQCRERGLNWSPTFKHNAALHLLKIRSERSVQFAAKANLS